MSVGNAEMSGDNAGAGTIDLSIDVAAAPDAVWDAVATGEGLSRWFAPMASAEAGEGGQVTVSWGPGAEWTSRISVWRPPERLQWVDASSETAPDGDAASVSALDYHVEPRPGGSRLRLVNSGLAGGDGADDFLRMMENGWRFFLWNLKHCLERHPGVPRIMTSVRPEVSGSREDVWGRLFGPAGLGEAPARAGERFRFELAGGEVLEGEVVLLDRPWAFAGVVESFGDGVLHVEMEGSGEKWKLGVWLSAYGVEPAVRERVGGALEATVNGLFS